MAQLAVLSLSLVLVICPSGLRAAHLIDTVAGTGSVGPGTGGFNSDGISATTSRLNYPLGVAVDVAGNIYIGDTYNDRVRRVDAVTGIITTVAGTGTGGYNGDGILATAAQVHDPDGISFDNAGNIYFADGGNHRIRKVDAATGIISTVAGMGTTGYNGDGILATTAQLYAPTDVFVVASGDFYIADCANHRIRKVDAATGIISTVAGNGVWGFSGDGFAATTAEFSCPSGVFVDASGNIYVADSMNNRIRKISNIPPSLSAPVSGPANGLVYADLAYSASATDPDGDQVRLGWDWNGDGVVDEWSGPVAGGTTENRSHKWSTPGTYSVQVKAADEYGAQSAWLSVALVITQGTVRVFPNPFASSKAVRGTVKFEGVPKGGALRVYTSSGQRVWSAVSSGGDIVEWDGRNSAGSRVAPGVYWWIVESQGARQRGKVVIE
jgi:sugar lactone lactonase YvrE